ncbi:MAG: gamma-glutamyl-gamma-aminobutyrate hydrolase family protein [Nocardioidaceae bacterium]
MTRPVIGVTSYVETASWGAWRDVGAVVLQERYVAHLAAAGATPVVVPPLPEGATAADAEALLSRLDALVLAGGADVESSRYGQPPHPLAQQPRPDRDFSELLLASVARDRVPVLGICRGMQVMAVAAGGELEQHLPDRVGHLGHAPGPATYGRRMVAPVSGSLLESITNGEFEVNCYHHQGVIAFPTYEASGVSDDGVVEAIESPASHFHLGVQWHPERGQDPRLFSALVAAAQSTDA